MEKGIEKKAKDMAKKMKKKGYNIKDIADLTGLPKEEIEQL